MTFRNNVTRQDTEEAGITWRDRCLLFRPSDLGRKLLAEIHGHHPDALIGRRNRDSDLVWFREGSYFPAIRPDGKPWKQQNLQALIDRSLVSLVSDPTEPSLYLWKPVPTDVAPWSAVRDSLRPVVMTLDLTLEVDGVMARNMGTSSHEGVRRLLETKLAEWVQEVTEERDA